MIKGILNKLVGDAGNIIDNVVTTKEEKMQLKNEMKKMILGIIALVLGIILAGEFFAMFLNVQNLPGTVYLR